MRLIILVLCFQISAVIASLAAAPYEYAYLWYAYRLQWNAGGQAAVTIAKGFKPWDINDGGTLDDFVKYIELPPKFGGNTALVDNFSPDVDDIASELSKKLAPRAVPPVVGRPYIDFKALLDDSTTEINRLSDAIGWVRDQITQTRRKYSIQDNADELTKMKTASSRVIMVRREENIRPMKTALEAHFAARGHATDVDIVVIPTEGGPKFIWKDTVESLRNGYKWEDFFSDLGSYAGSLGTDKAPVDKDGVEQPEAHYRTITSFVAARNDLFTSAVSLPCTGTGGGGAS